MDSTKADGGGKAVQAAAAQPAGTDAGDEGAGAAKPLDAPAAANNGRGEEVDDEQVERFSALLANIRAMRRVYMPGGDDTDSGGTASGGSGARKRLRRAEALSPWRPAFRLEDFEDADAPTSRCTRKKERRQQQDDEEKRDGTVVAAPPPPGAGARRFDSDSDSI